MFRKSVLAFLSLAVFACAAEDAKLDIQLKDVKKQSTLIIKTKAKKAEIGIALGKVYPKVFAFLNANKIAPSAPIALYTTADGENFEIEAGVVVPDGTKGEGEIVASELPAGKVAATIHTGPYENLPKTYAAVMEWLKTKEQKMAGPAWEVYVSDPGKTKPEELKTEVNVLVAEKK